MSDRHLTIAGFVVPYAVHRRWRTKEPATADQAAAFVAGHAGEAVPPGTTAWSTGRTPAWYTRGRALRRWEDGAADREEAAAEREQRRERDQAERRKAQDEGRSAWRRGLSLKACPYAVPHRLRKHWRAGWAAAKEEAYRRALP